MVVVASEAVEEDLFSIQNCTAYGCNTIYLNQL